MYEREGSMTEKRRHPRTNLESRLIIKQLDSNAKHEVAIEVTDISKTGMGFKCTEPLAIGGIYEGYVTIWTKESIHSFVEIIRIDVKDDWIEYGAIFVGMPEIEAQRIEIYQQVHESDK